MSLDVYLTPPACPHCGRRDEGWSANITHNLGAMAQEAGIYTALWLPDENGITHARQLIAPLKAGIALMEKHPERFLKHNPPNGWGSYADFLPWLREYLKACEEMPDAYVSVSR